MPSRNHLQTVARNLKRELNGRGFLAVARSDITQQLREVSGEDTTRIKSQIAEDMERALLEQGVRCFPGLQETRAGDTLRLFHAGTVLGSLVDLLVYPSKDTDKDLGDMIKKIKGQWNWSTPTGPAAEVDSDEQ